MTAPARIVSRAKMHLVTCAKNCGVAYMLLDKPELALPMIDRIVELQQVSLIVPPTPLGCFPLISS